MRSCVSNATPHFLSMNQHPQKHLIALGIQQPWAELILRGLKSIEIRNVTVAMRGPIYIYASQKMSPLADAKSAIEAHKIDTDQLPRAKVVGTIEIVDCRPCLTKDVPGACVSWEHLRGRYSWMLANPQRCQPPIKPEFLPYGMWFYPFQRRLQRRITRSLPQPPKPDISS